MKLADSLKFLKLGDIAVRRNPWFYADAADVLSRLEHADPIRRREWTRKRLEEVLWAARRSRYAQRIHANTDIRSWPLLTKREVQLSPNDFRPRSNLLCVQASTGGTTGAPLRLFRSLRSIAFEQACLDRMVAKLDADPTASRCAVLRTDAVKDPNDFRPPYWVRASGGSRLVFSSSHLNTATIAAYARALQQFNSDYVMGYPTSLESLCSLLVCARLELHIPRVLSSSEMLRASVWRAAQRVLGCRLLDYYGQAERVAFAYAQEPGEYRFLAGYAHVEFNSAGDEGEGKLYEIVGTPLWNLSMPLIRYRTGDLIRVPSHWTAVELEELALGLRTFSGVIGRDRDILLTPDGVRVTGISHFQRDVAHVTRIQVVQESLRHVTVRVLATDGFSKGDGERLMQNVRRKLPDSMTVTVERVDALERTGMGKTPFVIHRSEVNHLLQTTAERSA